MTEDPTGQWWMACVVQGSSQALQERVAGLEAALRRQDSAMDKLQAGAKRHMEASLRQGTTRKTLQQATQKEDKLRQTLSRMEADLTATRRSAQHTSPRLSHPTPHPPAVGPPLNTHVLPATSLASSKDELWSSMVFFWTTPNGMGLLFPQCSCITLCCGGGIQACCQHAWSLVCSTLCDRHGVLCCCFTSCNMTGGECRQQLLRS